MEEQDRQNQIELANYQLRHYCLEIGWGWAGAEITEAAHILSEARKLEQLGQTNVWQRIIDFVEMESYSRSAQYLIDCAKRYAEGISLGFLKDLDNKFGPKADSSYVRDSIGKLESLLPAQVKGQA